PTRPLLIGVEDDARESKAHKVKAFEIPFGGGPTARDRFVSCEIHAAGRKARPRGAGEDEEAAAERDRVRLRQLQRAGLRLRAERTAVGRDIFNRAVFRPCGAVLSAGRETA